VCWQRQLLGRTASWQSISLPEFPELFLGSLGSRRPGLSSRVFTGETRTVVYPAALHPVGELRKSCGILKVTQQNCGRCVSSVWGIFKAARCMSVSRPLCFAAVLLCQPDSNLRDGPVVPRKNMSVVAQKSLLRHFAHPWPNFLQGDQKYTIWPQFSSPVTFEVFCFQNQATYWKCKTRSSATTNSTARRRA